MRISDLDPVARGNHSAIRREVHAIRSTPGYKEKFSYFALGTTQKESNEPDVLQIETRKEKAAPSGSKKAHAHTNRKVKAIPNKKKKRKNRFLRACEDVLWWLLLLVMFISFVTVLITLWLFVTIGCIKFYFYMLWP